LRFAEHQQESYNEAIAKEKAGGGRGGAVWGGGGGGGGGGGRGAVASMTMVGATTVGRCDDGGCDDGGSAPVAFKYDKCRNCTAPLFSIIAFQSTGERS